MTEVRYQKSQTNKYLAPNLFLVALSCLGPVLSALAPPANAQQSNKIPRVGILQSGSAENSRRNIEAFHGGLREAGYTEGKNIAFEYRYADGARGRLPTLASELVQSKVDIILAAGTQSTIAAKQATSTIPIVVGGAGDLVRTGLVASLAQPGGNITGSTVISPDISGKRLGLLKELVPTASYVTVLLFPSSETDQEEVKQTEKTAKTLKVNIHVVEVRDRNELEPAYAAMRRENAHALVLIQSSFTSAHRKQLAELGTKNRLPTMCESARWTEDGCLISYGPDLPYLYRRAAIYVDKILKGAKPAALPVEQPTKFELVINLRTAKQIGLTVPQSVLYRADRVIK